MDEPTRRNLMIGLGGLALACLVVALVTVLLALDATPAILYAVIAILALVVIAELVLVLRRPEEPPVEFHPEP